MYFIKVKKYYKIILCKCSGTSRMLFMIINQEYNIGVLVVDYVQWSRLNNLWISFSLFTY